MDNCIFCRIAQKSIKSDIVYEDDYYVAFRDINPVAPVHILLIPKKHIESINAIEDSGFEGMSSLFSVIAKIAERAGIYRSGYRIVSNCGSDGGQTVNHLHFHIIGGRPLKWVF